MSFIGPRPNDRSSSRTLVKEIPYYNEARHRVKRGSAAGADQLPYGASVEDAREKLTYDLYYVKNRSLSSTWSSCCRRARGSVAEGVR